MTQTVKELEGSTRGIFEKTTDKPSDVKMGVLGACTGVVIYSLNVGVDEDDEPITESHTDRATFNSLDIDALIEDGKIADTFKEDLILVVEATKT